jgi:hypothetical protein
MKTRLEMLRESMETVPPPVRLRDYLTSHPHASSEEVVAALEIAGTRIKVRTVEFVRRFLSSQVPETVPNYIFHGAANGEAP